MDTVKQTPFSIGYCGLTFALQHAVPYGLVQNSAGNFIHADLKSVTLAAAEAGRNVSGDFPASITNAPGRESYPIASFTWLLIPAAVAGNKKSILQDFLRWMLVDGQADGVEALGFARLPDVIIERELQEVEKIH